MVKLLLLPPAAGVILLVAGMPTPSAWPRTSGAVALSYRVADDFFSWAVVQGAELTVVRTTGSPEDGGGEIVMVAGENVGGAPAVMARNVSVLVRALEGPATLGPGHRSPSGYGGTAVLDSFRFALRPGSQPATIGGRPTTHRILTVETWWIDRAEDGTRTPVRESGRADLWFAGDLPFSRVPLTLPPLGRVGGALPLSQNHPQVSAHVLEQVIGELEPLGLLLRAKVVDSVVPDENPNAGVALAGGAAERSIEVDSIRTGTEEPTAPDWAGLPVLSASQGLALEIGMLAAGEPCSAERTTGSFEFASSGPVAFMAGGAGASLRDGEGLGHASVVLGDRGRNAVECVLVIFGDSARAPGTYKVVAPSLTIFAALGQEAIVVHLLADPVSRTLTRFLALEQGEVRLERVDGRSLKGVIKGTGWVAELDPKYRRRVAQGLGFDASFETAVGVGGRR